MFNDYIKLDDFDKESATLVLNADSPMEALNQASSLEDEWIRGYDPTFFVGFDLDEFRSKRKAILGKTTLAYILAGLRCIPQQAYELKYLHKWNKMARESRDLRNARIGMIGLGMVGRNLLPLLAPFHPEILVYDPYLDAISLQQSGMNIKQASLDDVLHWGDILTLHASLTKETKGMLNREKLALIPDGGLLVNTARSGIIVEEALLEELRSGRIHAVLDVFDHEPLPEDSMFHELDNVILMPHVAGITAKEQMSFAMLDEIERLKCGLPLKYRIPYEVFSRMTQEKYPEEEC